MQQLLKQQVTNLQHLWLRILLTISLVVTLLSFSLTSAAWATPITSLSPHTNAFQQGVEATMAGNYPKALAAFTEAIQSRVNTAAAYANRCLVEILLNLPGTAIQDCTQALQRQPTNSEAYLNRGLAHYRLGHFQAAVEDMTDVLQLQPDDFRAYFNRGLAWSGLGEYEQAIADFNLALQKISPSDPFTQAEIYIDKGLSNLALIQFPGAIADFNRAIDLNPNSDRAYYSRGCLHRQQEHYLAAIQDFDRALQLNPGIPEAYRDRALAYYNTGNAQQAVIDLQQAAQDFLQQGKTTAYQQALSLMQQIRQSQASESAVG